MLFYNTWWTDTHPATAQWRRLLVHSLLISLDLNVAFDAIRYVFLLERLSYSFGIAGSVHSWMQSYLTDRSVLIGSHSSFQLVMYWCPQGFVLCPLHFSVYTSPISTIVHSSKYVSSSTQMTCNCMWLSCWLVQNVGYRASAGQKCRTAGPEVGSEFERTVRCLAGLQLLLQKVG